MYKETKPPCYQCKNRKVGCHGNCKTYRDWKAERDEFIAENRKRRDIDHKLTDTEIQRHLLIRKKMRRNSK